MRQLRRHQRVLVMRELPALVSKLCEFHDGWIVGSAATPDQALAGVRDFDVLVPHAAWPKAALLIPDSARPNTFGGWKCQSEGKTVDVWPDDLGRLFVHQATKYAWHPKTGVRLRKE